MAGLLSELRTVGGTSCCRLLWVTALGPAHCGSGLSRVQRPWGLFLRWSPPFLRQRTPLCETRTRSRGPGARSCPSLRCQAVEAH